MSQRILVLTGYLLRRLAFSLAGVIYFIAALVYWIIFFPPSQSTPDIENYILIIGAFGAATTFLITLTITGHANQAENYPLVVRLPSRVEYLTAVFLAAFSGGLGLQLIIALLALIGGPTGDIFSHLLEIPPIWLAPNILAAVLALHASDLAANGWSRVYLFGFIALLLIGQSLSSQLAVFLSRQSRNLGQALAERGMMAFATNLGEYSIWLREEGAETFNSLFGAVFWPFRTLVTAVSDGAFSTSQALAPAVIILYATILFLLVADLFATKDIDFVE